ncbi:MAG: conjugal transfer protein TraG N-terminal domain-containing protein [Sphingomonadaceae bacterium]|nr:conjugal transfer protein TraG N-terminal domain-containing protein [Sphingomonadaceae bacterium]
MNVEVFTIGGGDYIVNVFNAVAAWTGGGGYKSMIRVVMVMGLIYSLLVTAFNLDWRAWLNWFLQSTLIYLCLMVPTVTVKVTDRINPGLAPSVVANVPLGLGMLASFTSQVGDYLTRSAETVFVMPAQLNYSSNGLIYGSKLMEATHAIQITDPEFAGNLNEHMKQCVFYDVMLGFKSMDTLAKSTDLWTDIGPGSPARGQKFLTRNGAGGVDSEIKTCNQAYAELTPQWTTFINGMVPLFGKKLYPRLSNAAAAAKLTADLPVTYQAFTGNASTAVAILRQHLSLNVFMQARNDMSGGSGSAAIDSFAATRADVQSQNTYSAIAQGAMKWVPVLNIVLTVVFYAMFPVIFPLFLMPKTGVSTLRGYGMGFFYLAAWGPLYVVLHMILMSRATAAGLAVGGGGATLGNFAGMGAVNDETALLAGYLISSVPFIAAGMARGAMAIAGQATSFLAPSQNAAEAAALEATTGNYAYGNASLANATVNSRSMNQWSDAPSFTTGAATTSFRNANGALSNFNADGTTTVNQAPGISSFESKPSLTQGTVGELRRGVSQFESQSSQQRELAMQSTSAAITAGSQIFDTLQTSRGRDSVTGRQEQAAISEAQNLTRTWSDRLVQDYGWSRESADDYARRAYTGAQLGVDGSLKVGVAPKLLGVGGGVQGGIIGSITSGSDNSRTSRSGQSESERIANGLEFLNTEGHSSVATQSRESFFRATSTSSDAQIRGLTARHDASLTEARSHSVEAGRLAEAGRRYEEQASFAETHGFQISRDLSQNWQAFASGELARNPGLKASGYETWMRDSDLTPQQRDVRDVLEERFQQSYLDDMRRELGPVGPLDKSSIGAPASTTADGVREWGAGQIGSLDAQAPRVRVDTDERDGALTGLVSDRLQGADGRLHQHQRDASLLTGDIHRQGDQIDGVVGTRLRSYNLETTPLAERFTGRVGGTVDATPFARSQGVSIKPGTNVRNLDPAIVPAISAVAAGSRSLGLTAPTITSGRDRQHHVGSLHPRGDALDFRGNSLSITQGQALAGAVRSTLGPNYDVAFETSRVDPDSNHLHAEYNPKRR